MLRVPVTQSEASGGVLRDFEDGLGRRYRSASLLGSTTPLEILCFRHELTAVPAFEFALRERLARVAEFQHPSFARSRRIDKLNDEHGTVTLVSDGADGDRLIRILTDGDGAGPVIDVSSALHLIRQLIAAVAALHQHTRIAHGAIALERLFVTPRGQLLVVEHPLGAALEQLKYSRERYWKELRVALPLDAGLPRFDDRADLVQVGMVALSLILARPIHDDEYPRQIEELVALACARATNGTSEPQAPPVRQWLRRTLQLEARNSFRSAFDAQAAFGEVVSHDAKRHADHDGLITVVQRFPATPAPRPERETYEPLPLPGEHSTRVFDELPETEDHEDAMTSAPTRTRRIKRIAAIVALLAVTTAGLYAARERLSRSAAAPAVATGTMTVTTDPPGADVQIDGVARGQSPLTLALAPGAHSLVVSGNGQSRTIPITIAAGAEVSQYLDMPKAGADLGQLHVRTEPPGARVSVDGTLVGTTPMTIGELLPGDHTVTFANDLGSVSQKVVIEAGVPASLMVPMSMPAGTVASGWLTVTSPVAVDLHENGRLVGNSGIEKIMLPAGRHDIELVNEAVGVREMRTVHVSPGRTSSITITIPKGTVSLNAIPWASVFIDGQSVGDTPIGNLPLTVGPHEVVFRNAELGEQRRTITVTTRSAVRLSVDLTKK